MKTLSKTLRLKSLLENGYFPEKLPPPFTTKPFSKYRESTFKTWLALGHPPKSRFEKFSYPRIKLQRRNLAIVNPTAQLFLTKEITDNWVKIKNILETSKVSLDIPELLGGDKRAVPKPNFNYIQIKRLDVSSEFSHIFVSDISRYYGTIYTHAVPWAIYGKKQAKRDLHKRVFKDSFSNKIDIFLRKGQDNQTLGIPTGPDTSRIISELVAIAVEKRFLELSKLEPGRTFRFVDDWFIGYDSPAEAEAALSHLSNACSEYELEINHEKTKIILPSDPLEELWSAELREHKLSIGTAKQAREIAHYFSKAFHFANKHKNENVLLYALQRAKFFSIDANNYSLFESYILRAARSNQTVLPIVAQILINHNRNGSSVDKQKCKKLIIDTIRQSAPLGYHGEVAWALFLAKGLQVNLSKSEIENVLSVESSVCALISLDLISTGLLPHNTDTSFWRSFMNEDALYSNMWLLAYEADFKSWLPSPRKNHVSHDQYFSTLKSKGVYFYDQVKNVDSFKREKAIMKKNAPIAFNNTAPPTFKDFATMLVTKFSRY